MQSLIIPDDLQRLKQAQTFRNIGRLGIVDVIAVYRPLLHLPSPPVTWLSLRRRIMGRKTSILSTISNSNSSGYDVTVVFQNNEPDSRRDTSWHHIRCTALESLWIWRSSWRRTPASHTHHRPSMILRSGWSTSRRQGNFRRRRMIEQLLILILTSF